MPRGRWLVEVSEMDKEGNHPSQSDAKLVERPFVLHLSEHDLRHMRIILKRWAIEQTDWAQVRCAVGIYERVNEQLDDETKELLSGPPKPERDRRALAKRGVKEVGK